MRRTGRPVALVADHPPAPSSAQAGFLTKEKDTLRRSASRCLLGARSTRARREAAKGGVALAEHFVCQVDELAERAVVLVEVDDRVVGVLRVGGEVYAYENRCMHEGGPVCQGAVLGRFEEILDDGRAVVGERFSEDEIHLVCPWHGWEYNVRTGTCATDPHLRLRGYPTAVRDGRVFVVAP